MSVACAAMLLLSLPGAGGRRLLRPACLPLLLALFLLLAGPVRPISFHLPGKARKCLREEIHRDTLVTGEYEIAPPPGSSSGPSANLKVRPASDGQELAGAGTGASFSVPTFHKGRGRRAGIYYCQRVPPPPPSSSARPRRVFVPSVGVQPCEK